MSKGHKKRVVEYSEKEEKEDGGVPCSEDDGSQESKSESEVDPTHLTKNPSSSSRAVLKKSLPHEEKQFGSDPEPIGSDQLVPLKSAGRKRPPEEKEAHSKKKKKKVVPESSDIRKLKKKMNKKHGKIREVHGKNSGSLVSHHERKIDQLSEKMQGDVERLNSGVEMDDWEKVRVEEIELYSRKVELQNVQMKLVLDALKSVDL